MDRAAKILSRLNVLELNQDDLRTIAIQIGIAIAVIAIAACALALTD